MGRSSVRRSACAALLAGMVIASGASATGALGAVGRQALTYRTATKTVPDGGDRGSGHSTDSVFCPAAQPFVMGGGLTIDGENSHFDLEVHDTTGVIGDGADDKGLWIAGANNNSGSSALMTTTAICTSQSGEVGVRATRDIPPDAQVLKHVLCPTGSKVVGGGAVLTGDSPKVEVASTQPFDGPDADRVPDDGWEASANNGAQLSARLAVTAVCARRGRYAYRQSPRRPLPNNSVASASVRCPDRTRVTGGGVEITGIDVGIEVESSAPFDGSDAGPAPDDGWIATANNDDSGRAEHVRAYVICQR